MGAGALSKESIFITPKSEFSGGLAILGEKSNIKLTRESIEKEMEEFEVEEEDKKFRAVWKDKSYR